MTTPLPDLRSQREIDREKRLARNLYVACWTTFWLFGTAGSVWVYFLRVRGML